MVAIYPLGLPIALSLTGYNAFLTGLIVLLKRRDRAGVHYFIASGVIFLWAMGISFQLNNDLPAGIATSWGNFAQIMASLIPVTWLHFVLIYTEQKERFSKFLFSAYFFTACLFPFTFTHYY